MIVRGPVMENNLVVAPVNALIWHCEYRVVMYRR
jgi:hypothetical protein